MKKEASGKKSKLWLWIVIGVVLLAAIAVGVYFLFFNGSKEQTDSGELKLYWNVDRVENTDRDTGLSIRKPAEDGNYYVRFACDGEQVEIPVADKKLVNYIDSLDLMGLTLDENGYAVDVKPHTDLVSVIGESLYVQSVSGDTIVANSSIMMNGRRVTIKLNDGIGVYNVSGKGEFVGEPIKASELNAMDTISIFGTLVPEDSEEESVPTHIFVLNKPAESKIYWRADQFYDSTNKVTTREPDAEGAYTIKFFVDGETVDLKCKDKDLVTLIDSASYYWCHWGLEFDENGYIIAELDSYLGSRTLMQCERFDITEINDDGSYVATNLIKNNGAFVQGVVGEDCPIYDVSKAAYSEGQANRKIDKLQLGDRVCIWTDTMGNPVQIYVAHRLVDSIAYWNVTRSYDSANKQTSRTPNEETGLYEIELLPAGGVKTTYYTDDINLATAIDKPTERCVGLKVGEGNMIEYVYDMECIFGYTYFCNGYYVVDVTGSVCSVMSAAGSGYTKNGVMASSCVVYNVSEAIDEVYGEVTELKFGDLVYSCKTPTGEIASAYVTRRFLGSEHLYWNLNRMWDSTNKVSTRQPDDEGFYVFELVQDGKIITAKTPDFEMACTIDIYSAPGLCIIIEDGIIKHVYDGNLATGGTKLASRTITAIDGNEITFVSSSGAEGTCILLDDCVVTNVSDTYLDHKGEVTELKVGDYVNIYRDIWCKGVAVYVRGRETSKMAWVVDRQYDSATASTKREPDADGWYYIPLAIDGEVKMYKTQKKQIATCVDYYSTAFGVELDGDIILSASSVSYVAGIKGLGISNYTVENVQDENGNVVAVYTLGSADKTGTQETFQITEDTQIIDVSPNAEKFGAYVDLKYGDTIRTYLNNDGEVAYVFVTAHFAREGKIKAFCEHCQQEVYWNAYTNASTIPSYDTHFYLPADVELVGKQMGVYSSARDFEMVLDLNGHTLFRDGGRLALIRYNDKLSIIDSVGGGVMKTTNSVAGGGVMMITSTGYLDLYAGTVTMDIGEEIYYNSGLISFSSGEFNMYGGEIIGGYVSANEAKDAHGGNVVVSGGVFNMHGGRIANGTAVTYTYDTVKDGETVTKTRTAHAGNLSVRGSGVVNLIGGSIENGNAGSRGGNIYIDGKNAVVNIGKGFKVVGGVCGDRGGNIYNSGTLNISGEVLDGHTLGRFGGNIMGLGQEAYINVLDGAKISGGISGETGTANGGNICLIYSNLTVSGGEIVNGVATNGGNIYATESGGKGCTVVFNGGKVGGTTENSVLVSSVLTPVEINGGTLEGETNISKAASLKVSGAPVVSNLKMGKGLKIEVGSMSSGAKVTVNAVGIFSLPTSKANAYKGYFKAYDPELIIGVTSNNELKVYHPDSKPAYCAHCDAEADWMPWDGAKDSTGHYYLTGNLNLASNIMVGSGSEFVLDLRGYTVTGYDFAETTAGQGAIYGGVFYVKGDLTIMDTSSAKTGTVTGGKATRGGNIYVDTGATFTLYSGTITGGVADTNLGARYAKGDKYKVDGAEVIAEGGELKSTSNGRGGNIFSNGVVTLIGGAVTNGSALNGSGYGGNICATNVGGIVMGKDAVISGGEGKTGNNIMLMYSTLVMNGGQILDGDVTSGSSIYTNGTNSGGFSSITVNDGTIDGLVTLSGGVTKVEYDEDGNAYIMDGETKKTVKYPDYRTALVLNGGNIAEISAGSRVHGGKIIVSGKPVVGLMSMNEDIVLEMSGMKDGASIYFEVPGVVTTPFASKSEAQAASKYIKPGEGLQVVITGKNELEVQVIRTKAHERFCAHCGKTVTFYEWYGGTIREDGHYFLVGDVTMSEAATISKSHTVVVDLNGYTLTAAENSRVFYVKGDLSVIDSSANKTGVITGGKATRGGNIYVDSGAAFTLYSGSILDGVADNELGARYAEGEKFDENGNDMVGKLKSTSNGRGGNIFSNGIVTLKGGTVAGGKATNGSGYGGNICSTSLSAKIVINDGATVTGGSAKSGGNLMVMYSVIEMNGGVISDVVAGSAIDMSGTPGGGYSTLIVKGGKITDKITASNAGNTIIISGKPVIEMLSLGVDVRVKYENLVSGASIVTSNAGVISAPFASKAEAEAAAKYIASSIEGLVVTVTSANEIAIIPSTPSSMKYCDICKQEVQVFEWYGAPIAGANFHYELTKDVVLTEAISITAKVTINLNGHTITAPEGMRAFEIYGGTLNIQDTSANKTGAIIGSACSATGGNIYVTSKGTLNLYSGVITGGSSTRGGNLYINEGCTFNMYGGAVLNGIADNELGARYAEGEKFDEDGNDMVGKLKSTTNGRGGNIFNLGIVNVYGGTISGGQAISGSKYGGNIMTTGLKAKVVIDGENAVITDGKATTGNNISAMYSNMEIKAGQILNGEVTGGQSIYTNGTNSGGYSTVAISGGVVDGLVSLGGGTVEVKYDEDGKAYYEKDDKKVYVDYPDYRTEITVSGGKIANLYAPNKAFGGVVKISGKPVIEKITIGNGTVLDLTGAEEGTSITTGNAGMITTPFASKADAEKAVKYLTFTVEGLVIKITADNAIALVPDAPSAVKYCEACGKNVEFYQWNGEAFADADFHYYLAGDVTVPASVIVNANVCVDLNGYTLTAANPSNYGAVFYVGGELSVMDSSSAKTGKIAGGKAYRGGNIFVTADGTFNLYSGTITNGIGSTEYGTGTTGGRGGNIFGNGGDVNLYGGTVSNGSIAAGTNWGGNIFMTGGKLTVAGATITGGSAKAGGNIYLMYADMEMTDGLISGGIVTEAGDGIYLNGTDAGESSLVMSGGKVDGAIYSGRAGTVVELSGTAKITNMKVKNLITFGTLAEGADIVLDMAGVFTAPFETKADAEAVAKYVKAAAADEIVDITAAYELRIISGLPHIEKKCDICGETVLFFEWNGGTIAEADTHYYLTGNVALTETAYIAANIHIDLMGYEITAPYGSRVFDIYGGNLTINDSSANKTGKIIGNDYVGNGGTVYVTYGGSLNLYEGTIFGGGAARGGNIYVSEEGTFNMYGGTVLGGRADNELGARYVAGEKFDPDGVDMVGQLKSTNNGRGGNIFNLGIVNLYDGVVSQGTATNGSGYGGNICATGMSAKVYIENATVANGDAKAGRNINLMYSNLEIAGGAVLDGDHTNGSSIYTNGTNSGGYSSVVISGGTIEGAVSLGGSTTNTDVKYPDYRTALTISGGNIAQITGKAFGGVIEISGKPVISDLAVSSGTKLSMSAVEEGASITTGLAGVITVPFASEAEAEAAKSYIVSTLEGLVVTVTGANELAVGPAAPSVERYCEACGKNVLFYQWNGEALAPGDFHYYLNGDVTVDAHIEINANVCIDLNGFAISAANPSTNGGIFYVNGDLSIMDSSAAMTGKIIGGKAYRGGNVFVTSEGTFNLYSGYVTGGFCSNEFGTGTTGGRGGNIFGNGGVINLYGGVVENGSNSAETGMGSNWGGNLFLTGGTLNVAGATITGGTAKAGGNVYLMYADMVMTNGYISNGTVIEDGDGIYLNGTNTAGESSLVISGGEIVGTVYSGRAAAVVEISGTAKISNLVAKNVLTIGTLEQGAAIHVDAEGVFTAPFADKASAEAAVGYFTWADTTLELVVNEHNELELRLPPAPPAATVEKYCEHCQTMVEFTAWNGEAVEDGGHYYVAGPINLTSAINVNGKNVVIDLNGQTITADGCRAFYVSGGATLTIQGDGVVSGGNSDGGRGGNIYAASANLNLYGGTYIGGTATTNGNNEGHNVAVYNGAITINGNVVIGDADKEGHSLYLFSTTETNLVKGTVVGKVLARTVNFALNSEFTADILALRGSKLTAVEARNSSEQIAIKVTNAAGDFLKDTFTEALGNASEVAAYFKSASNDYVIVVTSDNKLQLVDNPNPEGPGGDPIEPVDGTYCEHCQQEVQFTEWDGSAIPGAGHYQLTADVTLSEMLDVEAEIVVDLNGFTIDATALAHAFSVWSAGNLSIQDSSTEKTGKVIGGDATLDAGTAYYGGAIYVNGGTFNLYSGTITAGKAKRGGNIYLTSDGYVNIYGGTVSNGVAVADSGITGRGGNIFLNSGSLTITGNAVISGGEAQNNEAANDNSGRGGNIFLNSGSAAISGDVQILDGVAGKMGGNVMFYNATATIGGYVVIEGGKSGADSNNLACMNTALTITENVVIGDAAADATHTNNILVTGTNDELASEVLISGGTIKGVVSIGNRCKGFTVSGKAVIEQLKIHETKLLTVGALEDGASIKILATEGVFTDVLTNANDVVAYFDAVDANYNVVVNAENKLEIVEDTTGGNPGGEPGDEPEQPTTSPCPHCTDVEWTEWNGQTESGHYYLTENVVLTAEVDVIGEGLDVVIDLRGFNITAEGIAHVFDVREGATLSIVDTVGTGVISGADNPTGSGGNVYVYSGATFNLYGGTITGGSAKQRGGNIYITSATCNLYGGAVIGGTIADAANQGANIMIMQSELNILGDVTISNDVDGDGEALYVWGTSVIASSLKMTAGTINGEVVVRGAMTGVEFSGTAVVSELTLMDAKVTKLGAFADGASVKFSATEGIISEAQIEAADLAYIDTLATDKVIVVNADNKLEVVEACVCGCKTPVDQIEWIDANQFFAERANGYTDFDTSNPE